MSEVHRLPTREQRRAREDHAAAVASRICHDLVSPLGAIANGLELLGLAGLPEGPEMALISESVQNATARIRFFRLAYGLAGDQPVSRGEVVATLGAVSRGGRVSYDWLAAGDQPRAEVKAVFLLLQCLETAMPVGGHVRVAKEDGAWEVEAEGRRLRVDEAQWTALQSPRARPPDGAALVQFALLPLALAELGRALALKLGPERVAARF